MNSWFYAGLAFGVSFYITTRLMKRKWRKEAEELNELDRKNT